MKALFYDNETTGLPLFNEPSEDPRQPHIVQLAAILVDLDTRSVLASIDLTCMPESWEIPEDVAKIHGITTELARERGVDECLVIELLLELWTQAELRIGHNEQFDARIVRIGMLRHAKRLEWDPEPWKVGRAECTQALARRAGPLIDQCGEEAQAHAWRDALQSHDGRHKFPRHQPGALASPGCALGVNRMRVCTPESAGQNVQAGPGAHLPSGQHWGTGRRDGHEFKSAASPPGSAVARRPSTRVPRAGALFS